jgi:hypothetical protein
MPVGRYKHRKITEETREKIRQANKKRMSFYDEILIKKLEREGKKTDWGTINKIKRKSALLASD